MSAPILDKPKQTRVRASKAALEAVLDALSAKGLAVEKLCLKGSQVEIHVGGVDSETKPENDGCLEPW